MDLSSIKEIYLGPNKIGAVYRGSNKLWPKDGGFAELHFWEADDSTIDQRVTAAGIECEVLTAGYTALAPTFTRSAGKVYFEVEIMPDSAEDLDSLDKGVEYEATQVEWYTYVVDGSGRDWGTIGDTACFALDLVNNRAWTRVNEDPWFNDVDADPATGIGYDDPSTTPRPSDGLEFYFFGYAGTKLRARLHASQFKYTPPAGFGEITLPGEYS